MPAGRRERGLEAWVVMTFGVWLGVLTGAALAWLAGALRDRSRRRVIDELATALGELAAGRPAPAVRTKNAGPIGRLARRFGEASPMITARLAELEREREQLRAVLGGMTEGVLAVDDRRRLLFANPRAEALFGLAERHVGRPVHQLIRVLPVQEAIDTALAGPGGYRGELVVPSRDGAVGPAATRVLDVRGSLLPGEPPAGAILVFHDVTDLRRLERMRQDFVANASHELKTPLATIKACTETLLDWALEDPEVNVRFLRQIDEAADRLNLLILDLLSLARLESGDEVFDHAPLAIGPVVRGIADSHRDRAEAKGLDYRLDLRALTDEAVVRADDEALRQVLDNLIDNAIKYTPEGGRVKVAARLDGDAKVTIEVADTGVGIPRDDLPRIFERFYRVDKARSREVGGTGLGLSIVKHIVQALGGQVGVSSRLGSGSVFTVRLPRYDPSKETGEQRVLSNES